MEPMETRYLIRKCSFYKDFLEKYRYKELEEAFLTTNDGLKLVKVIVQTLDNIAYSPEKRHCYYEEIRKCVKKFITYWDEAMDEVIRDVSKYRGDQDAVAELIEVNINRANAAQIEFGYGYLPVTSAREREVYDELEQKYRHSLDVFYNIKVKCEQRCLESEKNKFIDALMQQVLDKTCEMFEFSHDYIGLKLLENIDRICTNLDHVIIHVKNELQRAQEQRHETVAGWMDELYECHKGLFYYVRRPYSHGCAEKAIAVVTSKLEATPNDSHLLSLLSEALRYWLRKRREIGRFNNILLRLKTEAINCEKQQEIYNTKVCKELPGLKRRVWQEIGDNIQEQKLYVQRKKMDLARALMTHFSIKGPNYEFFKDYIGNFQRDKFCYRLYDFGGLQRYYVNCDGNLEKVPPMDDIIYRDVHGRYVPDDKDPKIYPPTLDETSLGKLYRRTEYASSYKLAENKTFVKVSKDCGHSDNAIDCGLQSKRPDDYLLLPSAPPLPILKNVMEMEPVQYIWRTFGGVLAEALAEVYLAKPNNPIHYLAHCLVKQINKRLRSEYNLLKEEAMKYREDILEQRREVLAAKYLALRAKQVKRRKPEESDNLYNWTLYYQQQAATELVTQINEMNWN